MKLGVYQARAQDGPLVLVPLCMQPGIEVEHLRGPLQLLGVVDTDDALTAVDWQPLLEALRGNLHVMIWCPLQIAAVSAAMDVRTSVSGVLLAG